MLIISRKKNQKIVIADDIEITILEVGRNRVRFGIQAPKHIPIQTRLKESPEDQVAVPHLRVAEKNAFTEQEIPAAEHGLPAAVGYFRRS